MYHFWPSIADNSFVFWPYQRGLFQSYFSLFSISNFIHFHSASVTGVLNELVSLTEAYKVISKLRMKRHVPQKQLVTWKGKLQPCVSVYFFDN